MIRLTRVVKSVLIAALILNVSAPAFADGLRSAAAEAVEGRAADTPRRAGTRPWCSAAPASSPSAWRWACPRSSATQNGEFSEFGEADSSKKKLRRRRAERGLRGRHDDVPRAAAPDTAPVMAVAPGGGVTVTKQVSW